MTLAFRNGVLYFGVVLTILMLVVFGAVGYSVLLGRFSQVIPDFPTHQSWFGRSYAVEPTVVLQSLGAAGILGILAVVSVWTSTRVFRRVSSAEVYFFTVFLMTLSLELLRIGQVLVIATDQPIFYGALITRGVVFGRLFGALSLFTASLYAAGTEYPRIGTLTLLLALISFLIVYFVPVDMLNLNATLVHRLGARESLDTVMIFLAVSTVASYSIAFATGRIDRGIVVFIGVVCLVVGRELLYHVPVLSALVAGLVLVALGSFSYILATRAHHLWY